MTVRILRGDVRDRLRDLPDESVHCVVTSPPYWGLRDYGHPGQIGLEESPQAFVTALVEVFAEVRRVLRSDGTLWLNLGDSYAGAPVGSFNGGGFKDSSALTGGRDLSGVATSGRMNKLLASGLKPKDLVGIPWRVAFALQADGWWLRQDIIWHKPNPMPESVRDRCTKAHEYIFLLAKSERYYYDAHAIADDAVTAGEIRGGGHRYVPDATNDQHNRAGLVAIGEKPAAETRNRRSVWTVATQAFSDAHFATFPPALIEPCILAGCPAQCCQNCGAPWERDIQVEERPNAPSLTGKYNGDGVHRTISGGVGNDRRDRIDRGFRPTCGCNVAPMAGTVLDPFGGAGTTGLVADRLQRDAILIELNPEYAAMAERRIRGDSPLFAEVA